MVPRRWLGLVLVGAMLVGVIALRLNVVRYWHAPAGDGLQYYQLSQELRRELRFAYSPAPAPLTYTRLPGYPLFLAAVEAPLGPLSLDRHVVVATYWNVLLDLGTALLVFGIVRRGRLRGGHGALLITLLWPTLCILSCFALAESLSTFLGTLEIYLAVRALESRPLRHAALAGLVAGFGQLVRADAMTFAVPAVVLLWGIAERRVRLRSLGAFAACALLVLAAWGIRNQLQFGKPHLASTPWRMMDGTPLGEGPIDWARTWSTSQRGEAWFDLMMANGAPLQIERPGVVLPVMFDDAAERAQLVALFERYNRERLSPAVDAAFHELARQRRAKSAWRYYVQLPLGRLGRLWSPLPEWELPFRVAWLGMPERRPWLGRLDKALFVAALGGALLAWRRGRGRFALALGACIAARSILVVFAIPHGVGGRYLVEIFPLLILLATQLWPIAATERVTE